MQGVAEDYRELQRIAEDCRELQGIAESCRELPRTAENHNESYSRNVSGVFPKNPLRFSENTHHQPHLRGGIPAGGGVHARGQQALFQSGGGTDPFVKQVYGTLLRHVADITHRQFSFAVAADGEGGFSNERSIIFHHSLYMFRF